MAKRRELEDAAGRNALDGNPVTFWHTRWSGQDVPRHPHHIIVDLGAVRTVYGIRYLPRQDGGLNGTIVGYEVYVSLECDTWDATPWMSGSWDATVTEKIAVQSRGQQGRYLKLVATSEAITAVDQCGRNQNHRGTPVARCRPTLGRNRRLAVEPD